LKGRLALLNLVLAALAAFGGWQLRLRWLEARAREAALERRQVKAPEAPPVAAIPPAQPVTAITYSDVAQKMLFSRDRNPNVEIEVEPPKPMPPLPVAYGVMAFGNVRSAILSPGPARRIGPTSPVKWWAISSSSRWIPTSWSSSGMGRPS
jgi:hypothetical protein